MKTKVAIKNLRVDTIIGIDDWEQCAEQSLFFNVEIRLNRCAAITTDSIDDALDYAAVASDIKTLVGISQAKLLEALLWEIVKDLFGRYPQIEKLSISVDKPQAIRAAESACVQLSLGKKEFDSIPARD